MLRNEGWLNPGPVRGGMESHLGGRIDMSHRLWIVLMFQAWLRTERKPALPALSNKLTVKHLTIKSCVSLRVHPFPCYVCLSC